MGAAGGLIIRLRPADYSKQVFRTGPSGLKGDGLGMYLATTSAIWASVLLS